jgi:hypothetical protein
MGKIYWAKWASLCGIAHTPAGLKCTSNQSIRSGPLRPISRPIEPPDCPTVSPNRGTGTLRSQHRLYGVAQNSGKPIR